MLTLLNFLVLVIAVLLNVAFITLLERKILGYSQLRKGPNKVGAGGILQPFNDAIKLFSKERVFLNTANHALYSVSPVLAIRLSLLVFASFPIRESIFSLGLSILFIYLVIRINVYPVLVSGWSSNRKYASIGALRAVAQTVSYEVSLALMILFFVCLSKRLNFTEVSYLNILWLKELIFIPLLGIWIISCLAETNRTPFDFAEGESELVSGFNIEYGAVGFALIFIAEYASIFFMSSLFVFFFFSFSSKILSSYLIITLIVFFWVWARTTLPRYRYDLLINLTWKNYLPVVLLISFYAGAIII